MEDNNKLLTDIKARNSSALETITGVVENTYSGRITRTLNAGLALMTEYFLYAIALVIVVFIFCNGKKLPRFIYFVKCAIVS